MKLNELATITPGTVIARFETSDQDEQAVKVDVLTLKEFNEALGLSYRIMQEKSQTVTVKKEKMSDQPLMKAEMLIFHLLSQKAAFLPKQYEGRLIPSNFVAVEFETPANPAFMQWYFNEHPVIRKQIGIGTQGSTVPTLTISHLRNIEVDLPPLPVQEKIGRLLQLHTRRKQLLKERTALEDLYVHHTIMNHLEEST